MFDYSPDATGEHFEDIVATARQQTLAAVPVLVARLHWDAASLAQYRSARLTDTLCFAAQQSPWHAGRLSSLDLEAVTPGDLTSLPTMTKADVMGAWDRIVTDPRLSLDAARHQLARVDDGGPPFLLDEYLVFTTGGSTGQPGVFVWSIEEFARFGASTIRFGIDAGDPPAKRLTFVAARSLRHPSAWPPLLLYGRHAGSRLTVPIDQPVSAIVEQLNVIASDSLWVVSSMLPALVEAAAAGALRISPRRIVVGADAVEPRALDAAEAVFGTRPVESYATTDVGVVADQTPAEDALMIHDDLMIVEPVDEDDGPLPPGELSHHVLVTSLHQRTMPMIRYRIDDRIRVAPWVGRQYPAFTRIASIEGRADDLFRYGDVTVHPHIFRSILTRHPQVDDYQVRQEANGAEVLIKVRGTCDAATLTAQLTAGLQAAGIPGGTVRVAVVDEIPRTRLGKRLRFMPVRPGG
ncbi:MAG TPA: hypothetical protein VFK56_22220 [Mycobacterium sp.]|nr:hypothetical protein [Mycobacterium sp.]